MGELIEERAPPSVILDQVACFGKDLKCDKVNVLFHRL